ncbi:hypothetical protein BT63DRAFT_421222 [Microthyrium microscopicum]|uniref:Uncharacterized protein n=1 Tax=Microthyrium microscopicum TaxID=703497 RepID=A0A6A6UPJ8_9PEZI|nr:hypothetical protein BT63DRAFT_421222 [Microthyrium microscopicum]
MALGIAQIMKLPANVSGIQIAVVDTFRLRPDQALFHAGYCKSSKYWAPEYMIHGIVQGDCYACTSLDSIEALGVSILLDPSTLDVAAINLASDDQVFASRSEASAYGEAEIQIAMAIAELF